jgi:tricorn protease
MKPLIFLFTFYLSSLAQANDTYFTSDPSLSPDATKIVFSYNSDLWLVPTEGGLATQITGLDGEESRPLFSPDGKWIAFSSTQYGNKDIFIVPSNGGEIKQLTFNSAYDDVDSWNWDSNKIYFTSNRENQMAGYSISLDGSTPVRLFDHYFNTVHNIAEHPKTGEIFFNETWESKNFVHRKRYKGDYNPDIKSYNPAKKAYKEYTSYRGKDFGVSIDQSGMIYFMSDEQKGEYNLYTFQNNKKKALTNFNTSIYWPKVSANGKKIVFRKDYQIYVYDVASGKTSKPNIKIFQNSVLHKEDEYKVAGNITDFAVSPDKKKLSFVSRGKLFVSDIEGKFIKEIPTKAEEAIGEVHWLKDNKTLLYSQSVNGYYNWFTQTANDIGVPKMHTQDIQNNRLLTFNSDQTQAVYFSGRNEIRMMDLETMLSETIVRDELWGFYNSAPTFSPDDKYIIYSAYRTFEQDILVYNIANKTNINLSNTLVTESSPVWSHDGKYIYFTSNLTQPSYPYGLQEARVYQMALDKYENPYRSDKFDELFVEKEEEKKDMDDDEEDKKEEEPDNKDEDKTNDKDKTDDKKKVDTTLVSIHEEGLMERITRISPNFGRQANPYVIKDGEKTIVLYISDHDEGNPTLWKTTLEDFEKPKTEKIGKANMRGFQIKEADGKYWILSSGNIHTLNPGAGKLEKIEINHTFSKNLKDEFLQMYYEAWAGMEQNFYDENFHGQDWLKLRDQYAAFIPFMTRRSDLRLIFNDMLGELNTSHFGFYSFGKEESTFHGYQTLGTGIKWDAKNPYKVIGIVKDGPADYKDKDIAEGDLLVEIDGKKLDPSQNREKYFSFPYMKSEMILTFLRAGEEHHVSLRPSSIFQINSLFYDEWQDSNQAYVDSKANKKIAYIHMKNMGGGELQQFKQDVVREAQYRDGLILDLRYNTGGNVHDEVLQWLSRKHYLNWKYREGALSSQPNFTPSSKPIVLLINEQSLSDAEMTAAGFKELGLGTIIGTETYRWIIFTSGLGLVDGSFYRLPSWGCYTLDGDDLEKTGVSPDIRVEKNFKDRIENNHPQLDKAIEVILDKLK